MSQSVQDLFRKHTNVDGDYFLMEILKVLGAVEDEDLSTPHHNTRILFLDKMSKTIGSCRITGSKLIIEGARPK